MSYIVAQCFFCSSLDLTIERGWNGKFYVKCRACGACGPDCKDAEMAALCWNCAAEKEEQCQKKN